MLDGSVPGAAPEDRSNTENGDGSSSCRNLARSVCLRKAGFRARGCVGTGVCPLQSWLGSCFIPTACAVGFVPGAICRFEEMESRLVGDEAGSRPGFVVTFSVFGIFIVDRRNAGAKVKGSAGERGRRALVRPRVPGRALLCPSRADAVRLIPTFTPWAWLFRALGRAPGPRDGVEVPDPSRWPG